MNERMSSKTADLMSQAPIRYTGRKLLLRYFPDHSYQLPQRARQCNWSVCFYSVCKRTDVDISFCTYMGRGYSSLGIEGQGHGSRPKVSTKCACYVASMASRETG